MNLKIENWNGYQIRFVEKEPNDWWAVLSDIAMALKLRTDKIAARLEKGNLSRVPLSTAGGIQEMTIVNELGIYESVFESRKKEAKEFKQWVFQMIKTLREATGLEAFQIFRMLDKEHQKEAMKRLYESLKIAERIDYIKANVIANKTVSTNYGLPKMVKKGDMSPLMLVERQQILDDTVDLMAAQQKFDLDVSISHTIYKKYLRV